MHNRYPRFLFPAISAWLLLGACGGRPQPAPGTALEQSLTALKGQYVWNAESKAYRYTAKPQIEAILTPLPKDETVSGLVGCLDSLAPSESLLSGKRVPLGVICYEALTQTVYHEPHDARGDIAKTWPGHISPTASADELRAAKKAWTEVLRARSYTFL